MMVQEKRNVSEVHGNVVISIPKKRRTERPTKLVVDRESPKPNQAKKMVILLKKPDLVVKQKKAEKKKKKDFLEKISKVNDPYLLCRNLSHELDGFGLIECFVWMGWEPILHLDNGYYPDLCMQFYANLQLINDHENPTLKTVVEGKEIKLTKQIIARVLGLDEGEEHKEIWSRESVLKEANLKSMIGFLIGETDIEQINVQELVKTNKLTTLARALSLIFFHIVYPRGHQEKTCLLECYVIYHMIRRTQKISLAYILFWNMWDVVDNHRKGRLVYCNLLSKLFEHFDVIGKHELKTGNGVHTIKRSTFPNIVFDDTSGETRVLRDKWIEIPESRTTVVQSPSSITAPSSETNSGVAKVVELHGGNEMAGQRINNARKKCEFRIKEENLPDVGLQNVSSTSAEHRVAGCEENAGDLSIRTPDISKGVETTLKELTDNQLKLWKKMELSARRERKRYQKLIKQTKLIKEMKQMLDQKVIGEISELPTPAAASADMTTSEMPLAPAAPAATTTPEMPTPTPVSHNANQPADEPKFTLKPADFEVIQSILFRSAAASGAHIEKLMESEHHTIHQRFNWIQDDLKATLKTIHDSVKKNGALLQKHVSDELVHLNIIHNCISQYGQKQTDIKGTLKTIQDSVQKIGALIQQHASDELINLNIINTSIHEYGLKQNENQKILEAAIKESQLHVHGVQPSVNRFSPVSFDLRPPNL